MGLLNFLKSEATSPDPLPTGSFAVDKTGRITTSTVPRFFTEEKINEIARAVLDVFAKAQEAGIPPGEITFQYAGLKMRAQSMRGGAMVFFHKSDS
jgi:hypothetical protein